MTDERTMQLISAAADGQLTADEQAELERLLESSSEAREFAADLEQMDAILLDSQALDVPGSLHARIVESIDLPGASPQPSGRGWQRPPDLGALFRYGLAAAAGVLLAVSLYESQVILTGTPDFSKLVGTMAPDRVVAEADIVDVYDFRKDGFASLAQLQRRDGNLYLDIQIEADQPLDISVTISPAGIWPGALAQLKDSFESIAIADSALQVRASGERRLTVLLSHVGDATFEGQAKIELEFSSNGRLLERGLLQATW
jgi:hypothetical protein